MCFSYNVDKVTLVDLSHLFYSHTGVKWVILPSQYSDEEYFNQTGNQHYTIVLTFSLFFFYMLMIKYSDTQAESVISMATLFTYCDMKTERQVSDQ